MAEPARQLGPYDKESETPETHPKFGVIEGGGQTGPPEGKLKAVPDLKESEEHPEGSGRKFGTHEGDGQGDGKPAGNLHAAPNAGGDDKLGKGFTNAAGKAAGGLGFTAKLGKFFLGSKQRKSATIASSVVGVVLAGFGLYSTFSVSGFEFIQIDHLMQQLHFETNQDESNDRVSKLIRYVRYTKQGRVERTNMGIIGNAMADRVEAKLNAQGLESSYTKVFGIKQGYIIDRNAPEFKNKSDDEIKQYVNDNYGSNLEIEKLSDGRLMIVQPTGYQESLALTSNVLEKAGYSKISSAISARIMGERDGVTLHPLRKLDAKVFKTLEQKIAEWQKEKAQNIENGTTDAQLAAEEKADKKGGKPGKQNAADATGQAQETIAEGDQAGSAVSEGNTGPLAAFTGHIGVKIGIGGTSAVAVLCLVRGIAANAGNIKESQLALPLVRIAMRGVSEGEQIEYGKSDIDPQQMQVDAKKFYDPTSKTTWFDAQSIQAGLGNPNTGTPPSSTLQNLGNGTPFDFLLTGSFNTVLAPVCSTVGQGLTTLVSFLGGPVSAIGSLLVGAVVGPPVISAISHWLAGDAADIEAAGADLGSNLDFGAHLGANDQAISEGMPALSKANTGQLGEIIQEQNKEQFEHQSIAYRLLSPTDSRSFLASIMDHESPTLGANITNALFGVMNVGHSVIGLFSTMFASATAHAAGTTYDYGGVPTYAMSVANMDNPLVANPYQNGDVVAGVLSGPQGQTYINRAQQCFGDTLTQTTDANGNQVWDVQYSQTPVNTFAPAYKAIVSTCSNLSDTNWLRICFFIFDTQSIKSLDCYLGISDSEQSCSGTGL